MESAIATLIVPSASAGDGVTIDPSQNLSASEALQSAMSSFTASITQVVQDATTSLAQATYTPSVGGSIGIEAGGVYFNASGGVVASFNFGTGDYVLPSAYGTLMTGATTSVLPGASVGVGASMGIGDISGFTGNSSALSIGPLGSPWSLTGSLNESFKSAGTQFSFGTSGGTLTQMSETTLQGEPQRGNVFSDIQSVENTLWNMSQDPITGTYR